MKVLLGANADATEDGFWDLGDDKIPGGPSLPLSQVRTKLHAVGMVPFASASGAGVPLVTSLIGRVPCAGSTA